MKWFRVGLGVLIVTGVVVGCVAVSREYVRHSHSSSGNWVELSNLAPAGANRLTGTWTGKLAEPRDAVTQLKLTTREAGSKRSISSSTVDHEGGRFKLPESGPVQLVLQRDAGTITLDGSMQDARGGGSVAFDADADYLREMSAVAGGEAISTSKALELALFDLRLDDARQIAGAGYKVSVGDLLSLKFAGITADYAVGMRQAGYDFSVNDLRSLRFGGVDVDSARTFRDAGYTFDADDLRKLRFSGVHSDYAKAFAGAGYTLTADELRTLRFAGVPADYAAELNAAGYRFTPDELRTLRFAGVPADFAADLKKGGYDFGADDLRRLRFSGVPADYA